MGAVCTRKDYRGQGIATRILKKIFKNLKKEKISLLTISGARGLYTRQGADFTSGSQKYTIGKSQLSKLDIDENNYTYNYSENKVPDDLKGIIKIYHREPVRYQRKSFEFSRLIQGMPPIHDVPFPPDYTVLTIEKEETVLAYIIGHLKENKLKIVEYAGDRTAVLHGLKYLNTKKRKLIINIPAHDEVLINIFDNNNFQGEKSQYGATYKIINTETFIKEITPIIEERVPVENLNIVNKLPVDISDKTKLMHFIFDNKSRKEYDKLWDEVLPLPLPAPDGLNYI